MPVCLCTRVSTLLVGVHMIERDRFEAPTRLYNIQVNAALGVETVEKLTDRVLELKEKIEQMSETITELIRSYILLQDERKILPFTIILTSLGTLSLGGAIPT